MAKRRVSTGGQDGQPNTPSSDATVAPLTGLPGRVLSTATMRNGPDATYAILGTIPRGAQLPVVGRNEDSAWLQVIYPPGSQLRGWVNASLLEVDGDVAELVIAGPGVGPQIPIPTSFGFLTPAAPAEPTAAPTSAEEPTATEERPTRRPRPSATRILVPTSTPIPPQPTAAPP